MEWHVDKRSINVDIIYIRLNPDLSQFPRRKYRPYLIEGVKSSKNISIMYLM